MSTITVELTIKVKSKFTSSNAETNWIHLSSSSSGAGTECYQPQEGESLLGQLQPRRD